MKKNKINALLGPTNTGKTFQAIDTMLSFESGMIGFPLRLLAREVYDKILKKVDVNKVALITGEEKIIPSNPKYYLCTVESMPIDKDLDFVGIDEIQMCCDHERGHIFTDRILNLRGNKLTMFMGSNTMKNILGHLDEDIEFNDKERFSKLSYAGYKKISRIAPKSAIIAFSAEDVYAIAELIRRQKGGAAIVMGSLSPKTRNAQVDLYQSGDVDYLVATDAIGMGINMDLDNVYFSNLKKFDGKKLRRLNLSEISQIAGRAGRYLNDGYFGITGECKDINPEEVEFLEKHKFESINTIFWRNSDLKFNSIQKLINSLEEKPKENWLKKINECEDEKVLKYLLKETKELKINENSNELKLLWECCQIPDFVKKTYGHHLDVVKTVFNFLKIDGKIPNKYMKKQLSFLDKTEGNVDSISNRIANVRTWSYVANKSKWVDNQDYWIERTKYLEDKLSDSLHDELIKTFIDKRASVLARGLKQDVSFNTIISDNDNVKINQQYIGKLKGLKLELDLKIGALDTDVKSLKKAARQTVSPEIIKRIEKIIDNKNVELRNDYKIYWENNPIAKLKPGKDYLSPEIYTIVDDMLESHEIKKLTIFLENWILEKIERELKSLFELKNIKDQNSDIRALAFHLYENNGVVKRESVLKLIKKLKQEDRLILRKIGVKFGRYHIFLFKLFKPNSVSLRILLWKNFHQKNLEFSPPKFGLNFLESKKDTDNSIMLLCGFEKFKNCYVRIDILERLFLKIIDTSNKENEIKIIPEMMNLLGCSKDKLISLLNNMEYKCFDRDKETYFKYSPKRYKKDRYVKKIKSDNPFNILNKINFKAKNV